MLIMAAVFPLPLPPPSIDWLDLLGPPDFDALCRAERWGPYSALAAPSTAPSPSTPAAKRRHCLDRTPPKQRRRTEGVHETKYHLVLSVATVAQHGVYLCAVIPATFPTNLNT